MAVVVRGGANVDMKGPRLWAVIGVQLNKLGFYMVSIQLSSSNIYMVSARGTTMSILAGESYSSSWQSIPGGAERRVLSHVRCKNTSIRRKIHPESFTMSTSRAPTVLIQWSAVIRISSIMSRLFFRF